jgi:hypothetical protein
MAEWGRKEYSKAWPSRTPVWTWAAILLSFVFFAGVLTVKYMNGWTAAQRLYLTDYLKSGARGQASPTASAKYTLLEGVVGKGQRLLIDDEIEPVTGPDGKQGWRLTDEGVKDGIARLEWVTATYNDKGLHALLGQYVFLQRTRFQIGAGLLRSQVF